MPSIQKLVLAGLGASLPAFVCAAGPTSNLPTTETGIQNFSHFQNATSIQNFPGVQNATNILNMPSASTSNMINAVENFPSICELYEKSGEDAAMKSFLEEFPEISQAISRVCDIKETVGREEPRSIEMENEKAKGEDADKARISGRNEELTNEMIAVNNEITHPPANKIRADKEKYRLRQDERQRKEEKKLRKGLAAIDGTILSSETQSLVDQNMETLIDKKKHRSEGERYRKEKDGRRRAVAAAKKNKDEKKAETLAEKEEHRKAKADGKQTRADRIAEMKEERPNVLATANEKREGSFTVITPMPKLPKPTRKPFTKKPYRPIRVLEDEPTTALPF